MARTASNGRFRIPRHIAAIDQAIIDTLTGRSEPILLIEAPPRHGKSELVSRFLPAWYLGVWPERRVMLAAYEATFARSWGRKARQVFHESAGPLFSRRLSADNTAADDWSTTDGGGMTTAGVGGPMTGRGAAVRPPQGGSLRRGFHVLGGIDGEGAHQDALGGDEGSRHKPGLSVGNIH